MHKAATAPQANTNQVCYVTGATLKIQVYNQLLFQLKSSGAFLALSPPLFVV